MAAALQTLRALASGGRAVAVLGDMLELGAEETQAHVELGSAAASQAAVLLFFGPRSRHGADAAQRAGAKQVTHTEDAGAAIAALTAHLGPRDVVLIKGSRGMRMERIVAGLTGQKTSAGH
jgi:UDP-N-acetylmuramoyl-tripeptide--D-alanyl-D-alanine ligase